MKPPRQRPTMRVEPLEPRLLYSADAALWLGAAGVAESAHVRDVGGLYDVAVAAPAAQPTRADAAVARHEIVFIDSRVPDATRLVDELLHQRPDAGRTVEIVTLNADEDGVAQIARVLAGEHDLAAVHIISHGAVGEIQIGSTLLDAAALAHDAGTIAAWGHALAADADLLLYGCNVAQGETGAGFVQRLADLSGADVGASTDATGSAARGGNWVLEYQTGAIAAAATFNPGAAPWAGLLAITANGGGVSSNATGGASSLSFSHTVAAGVDRVLLVEVAIDNLGAPVSGINYGGQALTQVGRGAGNHAVEIWRLVDPAVGTANVVVSFTATTAAAAGATTYNGVDQTSPTYNFTSASGSSFGSSVTLASATGDLVIDVQYWNNDPFLPSIGAGQSLNWTESVSFALLGRSSSEAGAASVTMTGSTPSFSQWEMAAVALNAAPNHPPVTSQVTLAALAEDGAARLITQAQLLANASDVDGPGALAASGLTISAGGGNLVDNGNGTWSYTPAPNDDTAVAFGYWVSDGVASVAGSATLDLTPVNDAPGVATSSGTLSYTENDAALAVDPALTLTDIDNTNLVSASVSLSSGFAGGQDTLAFTNQNGIIGSWNAGSGVLTLTGSATVANYEVALRSITYVNTSDAPSTTTRTVSFTVNDGSGDSNTGTRNIAITTVNDAPTVTNGATASLGGGYTEDMTTPGFQVQTIVNALGGADADAGALRGMALIGAVGNGQMQYSTDNVSWRSVGAVSATNALLLAPGSYLRYIGDGQNGETASIQFRAWDLTSGVASTNSTPSAANPGAGGDSSAFSTGSASANVSLASVNDVPVDHLPASFSASEDTPFALTGLSITDPDAGSSVLTTTLAVTAGSLTAASASGVTVAGSGTASITLAGTLTNLNAYLAGAITPVFNDTDSGAVQLSMVTSDGQNTGTGGALAAGGLGYQFWVDGAPPATTDPDGVATDFDVTALAIARTGLADPDNFNVRYAGIVDVTTGGSYTFNLNADDTASLSVDGVQVVSAFFAYAGNPASGSVTLAAGRHSIDLVYHEGTGASYLAASYAGPDTAAAMTSLFSAPGVGRLVSQTPTASVSVAAVNDAPGALLLTAPAPINLVANGSFEVNNGAANTSSSGVGVTVAGWTPIGGEGFEVWNNYNHVALPGPATASNGISRLELDVGSALNGISQSISTSMGQTYLLSFDFSNRTGVANSEVEVYWAGNKIATVQQAAVGWQTYRLEVTGSGGAEQLRFMETAAGNEGVGSLLDNVRLVATQAAPAALPENSVNGTPVVAAVAVDPDAGDSAVYSLVDSALGRFAIDAATGVLSVADASRLDFESASAHNVTVRATDGSGLYVERTFSIALGNVNEPLTAVADAATAVEASGIANATTGSNPSGNVLANDTDPDAGDSKTVIGVAVGTAASTSGQVGVAVSGSYGTLTIAADGSYTYTVDNSNAAVQALFDASTTLADTFTYTARDAAGLTSSTQLSVTIRGADDAPVITSDPTAAISVAENTTAVTTVTSTDVDGGTPMYSLLAGGDAARFVIDPVSGVLRFIIAPDYEAPTDANADNVYQLTLQVADGHGGFATQALSVTVTDVSSALVVTTTADSNDTGLGASFTAEQLNASRGSDGAVSLREAIIAANGTAGADTITFAIPGTGVHTINVLSALPTINDTLILDASSDDSFAANGNRPAIVLDGNGIAAGGLVLAAAADGSTIRGLLIRHFGGDGIVIQAGSDGNTLVGNFIGRLTAGGTDAGAGLGNAGRGISVLGANNTIGGAADADRNVVSGNTTDGIRLDGGGNTVQGNIIGLNAAGTASIGNLYGITNYNAAGNVIGGASAAAGNLIGGNLAYGVWISGAASTGVTVQGNHIGTDVSGTVDLGNANGVLIDNGASNNLVGGTAAGAGNVIAFNGALGVGVAGGTGNALLGNVIHDNRVGTGSGLGIDLGAAGVQANDLGDADSGANDLQNFPVLTSASAQGGNLSITGTLNSAANSTYRIEFFANASGSEDPNGHGEAQRFLGWVDVTTDGSGNALIGASLTGVSVVPSDRITATATQKTGANSYGSTSEFALNIAANTAPVHTVPGTQTVDEDTTLAIGGVSVVDAEGNLASTQLSVAHGTLTVGLAGGAVIASGANGSATLTLTGTAAQINAALATIAYQGVADFNGSDTLTLLSTDTLGASAGTAVALNVSAVNDAPAVHVVAPRTTNEDVYKAFSVAIGNAITVSDVDAGSGLLELTVTAAQGTVSLGHLNGLTFSAGDGSNDVTMTFTGTVAAINNALDGIRYQPTPDYNGPASLTFSVSDLGNAGSGGALGATATQVITVLPVSDAPVWLASANFNGINEDQTAAAGQTVASLFSGADADAAALQGIALYGQTPSRGTWQYSLDGGSSWSAVGSVSSTAALLLRATDSLRFVPDGLNADSASIAFYLWDQTAGAASGSADVTTRGGSTAFSAMGGSSSITVAAVNDAPVITNGASLVLAATDEDTNSTPVTVASIAAASVLGYGDADAGALRGLAITGFTGLGAWQYSTDGATWVDVGPVTANHALLLDASAQLRYRPDGRNGEAATLSVRAWDGSSGSASTNTTPAFADPGAGGGSSAFSLGSATLGLAVGSINDTPTDVVVLNPSSGSVLTVAENAANGTLVGNAAVVDVDVGDTATYSLTDSAGGRFAIDVASGVLRVADGSRLDFEAAAAHTVTVRATDAGGLWVERAVTVGVIDVNEPVTALPDTAIAVEAGGIANAIAGIDPTGNVLTNDSDPDNGDSRSVTGVVAGSASSASGNVGAAVSGSFGALRIAADGSYVYSVDNNNAAVQALRDVSTTLTDTFTYTVTDAGGLASSTQISVTISGANDAAAVVTSGAAMAYTENAAPTPVDANLSLSDVDGGTLAGAVVQISGHFVPGEDVLAFASQNGITGNWNASTGVLSLGGASNLANYQAALRSVTYWNRSDHPDMAARTVSFSIDDGSNASAVATRGITVAARPDVPRANADDGHLLFDGQSDVVVVAPSASLQMSGALTIEAWIKPDASSNATRIIVNKEGEYELALFADGSLQFAVAPSVGGWNWHDTGTVVANGAWTHVALSFDHGTVDTYVNGNRVDTWQLSTGTLGDTYPGFNELRIGGRSANPAGQYFAGAIDDVRVWNVARTQSEIGAAMARPLAGSEAGLVGYWRFGEAGGMSVVDASGHGNNGTLVGNPIRVQYAAGENTPLVVAAASGVLANDRDEDGDTLTVTALDGNSSAIGMATSLASGARVTLGADSSFTYDANGAFESLAAGAVATDSFSYTVSDGQGHTSTATVKVVVTGANDAPLISQLNGDIVAFFEGSAPILVDQGLPAGAFDIDSSHFDGGTLVVSVASGGVAGEDLLGIRDEGSGPGQIGFDGNLLRYAGSVIGDVTGGSGGVPLSIRFHSAEASGAAVSALLRNISYGNSVANLPTEGARGLRFVLTDGDGGSSVAALASVIVSRTNDAPAGTDRTLSITEDGVHVFSAADFGFSDTNDNPANVLLGVRVTTLPGAGSLTLNGTAVTAGQTVSAADIATGSLVFAPAADANGAGYASVRFQLQDDGGTAAGGVDLDPVPRTITFDVAAVNDAPVLVAHTGITVAENAVGTVITPAMLATTDVDNSTAQLVYTLVSAPTHGALNLGGAALVSGATFTQADIDTGRLSYDHDGSETTADGFAFSVDDGSGKSSAAAFAIVVTPVNDQAPEFVSSAAVNVAENSKAVVTLAAVDADLPTGTIRYAIVGGADAARFTLDANTHQLSFVAAPDFEQPGDADADNVYDVIVRASDGSLASTQHISVTVNNVNEAPAGRDKTVVTAEDTPYRFSAADFGFGDVDAGDTLGAVRIDTLPGAGGLSLSGTAVGGGQIIDAANLGQLVFTPTADANGTAYAGFGFSVQDAGGMFDATPKRITVAVSAVNDAPVLVANTGVTVAESAVGTVITSAMLATVDVDNSAAQLVYTLVIGPVHGTLNLGGVTLTAGGSFTQADIDAGRVSYDHGGSETTTDGFVFTIDDGYGKASAATFRIAITPVNEAPTGTSSTVATAEDTPYRFTAADFGFNDVDSGDTLGAVRIDTLPGAGRLSLFGTAVGGGQIIDAANLGQLVFTPTADANGTAYAGFAFSVQDAGGLFDATPKRFTIDVSAVNDSPVLVANTGVTVAENAAGTLITPAMLATTDVDTSAAQLVYTLLSAPTHGTLNLAGATLTAGASFTQADIDAGRLSYDHDGSETTADGFGFGVGDGSGRAAAGTFAIGITPVNDQAPRFTNDGGATAVTLHVAENTAAVTRVQAVDDDVPSVPLTYRVAGGADAALFSVDAQSGVLTFVVPPDFEAPADADRDNVYQVVIESIEATEAGTGGLRATQTFAVVVDPVNEAPTGSSATITTPEDTPHAFSAADFGFRDADAGDSLGSVRIDAIAGAGRFLLAGRALLAGETLAAADLPRLVFVPAADANGSAYASLTFSVADASGRWAPGSSRLQFDVTPVDDAPVVTAVQLTVTSGQWVTLGAAQISASDVDSPVAALRFVVSEVQGGRFELASQPGQTITGFSQAELLAGRVRFLALGGSELPSFRLAAFDGTSTGGAERASVKVRLGATPGGAADVAVDLGPAQLVAPTVAAERERAAAEGAEAADPAKAGATETAVRSATVSSSVLAVIDAGLSTGAGDTPPASPRRSSEGATARDRSVHRVQSTAVPDVLEVLMAEVQQTRLLLSVDDAGGSRSGLRVAVGEGSGTAVTDDGSGAAGTGLAAQAVQATGAALSVGTVWWALRAGGLVTSLLVVLPAWRHVDLLAVLPDDEDEDDDWDRDSGLAPDAGDDEAARDEQAVRRVLEPAFERSGL